MGRSTFNMRLERVEQEADPCIFEECVAKVRVGVHLVAVAPAFLRGRHGTRHDVASASICAFVSSLRSVFVIHTRVGPMFHAISRRWPLSS